MRNVWGLVFFGWLLTAGAAQEAELPKTLVLVADEWAPYNIEPNKTPEGYMVDIAREVFQAQGITVVYQTVPWNRALEETEKGSYDGVIGASMADAQGFIFPLEPLAINYLGFFTNPESDWKYLGEPSLSKVGLGVIDGYDYRPWLTAYVNRYKREPSRVQVMYGQAPLEANLKKLRSGRLDVVVDSVTAVRYTAQSLGIPLRLAGTDTEPAVIHIAFSPAKPSSAALAKILSAGIQQLRNSGRLAAILSKYGLTDWKD